MKNDKPTNQEPDQFAAPLRMPKKYPVTLDKCLRLWFPQLRGRTADRAIILKRQIRETEMLTRWKLNGDNSKPLKAFEPPADWVEKMFAKQRSWKIEDEQTFVQLRRTYWIYSDWWKSGERRRAAKKSWKSNTARGKKRAKRLQDAAKKSRKSDTQKKFDFSIELRLDTAQKIKPVSCRQPPSVLLGGFCFLHPRNPCFASERPNHAEKVAKRRMVGCINEVNCVHSRTTATGGIFRPR